MGSSRIRRWITAWRGVRFGPGEDEAVARTTATGDSVAGGAEVSDRQLVGREQDETSFAEVQAEPQSVDAAFAGMTVADADTTTDDEDASSDGSDGDGSAAQFPSTYKGAAPGVYPDVTKTPTPPTSTPIPYPDIGQTSPAQKGAAESKGSAEKDSTSTEDDESKDSAPTSEDAVVVRPGQVSAGPESAAQMESRKFQALSSAARTAHEVDSASINNIRGDEEAETSEGEDQQAVGDEADSGDAGLLDAGTLLSTGDGDRTDQGESLAARPSTTEADEAEPESRPGAVVIGDLRPTEFERVSAEDEPLRGPDDGTLEEHLGQVNMVAGRLEEVGAAAADLPDGGSDASGSEGGKGAHEGWPEPIDPAVMPDPKAPVDLRGEAPEASLDTYTAPDPDGAEGDDEVFDVAGAGGLTIDDGFDELDVYGSLINPGNSESGRPGTEPIVGGLPNEYPIEEAIEDVEDDFGDI